MTMPDIDFADFCRLVSRHTGFELSAYKPNQMERRTRAFALRKGAASLGEFWALLESRPPLAEQYLDYLTINVTGFFRDGEAFREAVAAAMTVLARAKTRLSLWSAGCAGGAEACSLWMLLQGYPAVNARILATDIDRRSIARAREGRYSDEELAGVPTADRERWFLRGDRGYQAVPAMRAGIDFTLHDLLQDPYPSDIDLLVCRNVLIYFAAHARALVCRQLIEALAPGGYLFLGSTERVIEAKTLGLLQVLPHLYCRP